MIKFANLHDDIGNDIYDHREDQPNRLDEFHYPRFKQGNMKFSAIVSCFGHNESWETMQDTISYVRKAVENSNYFSFGQDKEIQVFLAVEGMCGIQEDAFSKVKWLYENKIRLASLCWNDKNALACGAKSGNEPLTPLGIETIQAMNHFHIAVDISHCCEWNFYDILRISTSPVIASHSNAKKLYHHYRNLSDEQLLAIKQQQGLVGLIPIRWFVKHKDEQATLQDFIEICKYMKHIIGCEHMALGFDFMDYYPGLEDSNVVGMQDITEIQNLQIELSKNGFTEQEIQAICFDNTYRFMKQFIQ